MVIISVERDDKTVVVGYGGGKRKLTGTFWKELNANERQQILQLVQRKFRETVDTFWKHVLEFIRKRPIQEDENSPPPTPPTKKQKRV